MERRQIIQQNDTCINKISDQHTVKTALEELRDILTNYATDGDRILIAISAIQETNNASQKMTTKREHIKLIGLLAQIFEEKILDYLPRILGILGKRIKDSDATLQGVISEAFGQLIEFSLRKVDPQTGLKYLQQTVKTVQQNFSSNSVSIQQVSAMSLQRIIQSAPPTCMLEMKEEFIGLILDLLKTSTKVNANLLDSLLALIMGIEDQFRPFVAATIPILLEHLNHQIWNVRKIAVDVIYTLCMLMCESLEPFIDSIVETLSNCRFDKIKHVRDSATIALATIKEKLGSQYLDRINQAHDKKPVPSTNHPQIKKVSLKNQSNKNKVSTLSVDNIHIPNESSFRENPHQNNQFKTKNEVERKSASKRRQMNENNLSNKQIPQKQQQQQQQQKQTLNKKSINPEFLKNAVKGDEIKEGKKTPLKVRAAEQNELNEQNEKRDNKRRDLDQWDIDQRQRQQEMQQGEQDEGGQADVEYDINQEEEEEELDNDVSSQSYHNRQRERNKKANIEDEQYEHDVQIFVSGSPPSKAERERQYQNILTQQSNKQSKLQIIQYNDRNKRQQDYYGEQKQQQQNQYNQYSPNRDGNRSSPDKQNNNNNGQKKYQHMIDQERQYAQQAQRSLQQIERNALMNDSFVVNQLAQIEDSQGKMFERLDFIENDMNREIQNLHQRVCFLEDTLEKLYQAQAQNQHLNQQFMNYRFQLLQLNQQQQQQQLKNIYSVQPPTPLVNSFFPQVIHPNMMSLDSGAAQMMQAQQELLNQQQQQLFPFLSQSFSQAKNNYMQTAVFPQQQKQADQKGNNQQQKQSKKQNDYPPSSKNNMMEQTASQPKSQQHYSQQLHQGEDLEQEKLATHNEALQNKKKVNKDHIFEQQSIEIQQQKRKLESSPPQKNTIATKQNSSSNKKKSPSKGNVEQLQTIQESNIVDKINKSISEDKLNEAYGLALTSNDDDIIFEVMKSTSVCTEKLDEVHIEFLFSKFKGYLEKLKNTSQILNWIGKTLENRIPLSENVRINLRDSLRKMIDNGMDKKDGILQTRDHHTALKLINQLEQSLPQVVQQKQSSQIPSSNNLNTQLSNAHNSLQFNQNYQNSISNGLNNPSIVSIASGGNNDYLRTVNSEFKKEEQSVTIPSYQPSEPIQNIKDTQFNKLYPNQNYSTLTQQIPTAAYVSPQQQQQQQQQQQPLFQTTFSSTASANQQPVNYPFNPEIKRTLDFSSPTTYETSSLRNNNNLGIGQNQQSSNQDYLLSNKNGMNTLSSSHIVPNMQPYNSSSISQNLFPQNNTSSIGQGNISNQANINNFNSSTNNLYQTNSNLIQNLPANKYNDQIGNIPNQPFIYESRSNY